MVALALARAHGDCPRRRFYRQGRQANFAHNRFGQILDERYFGIRTLSPQAGLECKG